MPSEWTCVECLSPDPKLHDPLSDKPPSTIVRGAGSRALAGDHRLLAVAPQLGDRVVRQVGTGRADRQVGGHRHPAGRGVGVRQVLEHLERVHGVELGAAQLLGNPQLQQAVAVQCVDGRGRQLALVVGELRLGVEQRNERLGSLGEDGCRR